MVTKGRGTNTDGRVGRHKVLEGSSPHVQKELAKSSEQRSEILVAMQRMNKRDMILEQGRM